MKSLIVEFGVAESAPWHKEFPLSKGDYNNVVDNPVNREYRDKSLRDYAIARFAAIQLACGKGLIGNADDTDEREGSPIQKNENRKNPIIWLTKSVLLFESADKFARYGRRAGRAHEGVKTVSITRRAALHYSEITARDFENVGDRPFLSGYYPIFVGEPKRVANASGNVAAFAKGNTICLTCGSLIPDAVMISSPPRTLSCQEVKPDALKRLSFFRLLPGTPRVRTSLLYPSVNSMKLLSHMS